MKGFTQLHPEVPERLRGTYLGLATEAGVRHLTNLGITAVELMPVHHFLNDRYLVDRGLNNYWGYSTLGFFAPASRYTATRVPQDAVQQFKIGQTSIRWTPGRDVSGDPVVRIRFHAATCRACPVRQACTRAKNAPRQFTVRLQAHHEAIQAARQR